MLKWIGVLVTLCVLSTDVNAEICENCQTKRTVRISEPKITNVDFFDKYQERSVIGVPVTDYNVDYYYKISQPNLEGLSDRDIEKIVEGVKRAFQPTLDKTVNALIDIAKGKNVDWTENDNTSDSDTTVNDPVINDPPIDKNPILPTEPIKTPNSIKLLLKNNCVSCHGNTKQEKGYNLLKLTKKINDKWIPIETIDAWRIFNAAYTGQMPKNSTYLTDEEVESIRQWAESN